jgi:hypothetical protein
MEIPAQEQKWQAEQDARTLAEGKLIKSDIKRHRAAMAEANRIAVEKAKEAQSFNSLSKDMYPSMKESQ